MKNGFRYFEKFKEELDSDFIRVSPVLLDLLNSDTSIKTPQKILLFYAYISSISRMMLKKMDSGDYSGMRESISDEGLLVMFKQENPNYKYSKVPLVVVSRKKLDNIFGSKNTKYIVDFLSNHGFINSTKIKVINSEYQNKLLFSQKAYYLPLVEYSTNVVITRLNHSKALTRFKKVLSYDIGKMSDVANSDIGRTEFNFIIGGLYKAKFPKSDLDLYQKDKLSYVLDAWSLEVSRWKPSEKEKTFQEFIDKRTLAMDTLLEWQETPSWDKPKFISTCIGNRLYSPLNQLPKKLRDKLCYVRNGVYESLFSLDISSSVPSIVAWMVIDWLKYNVGDRSRNFPRTLEEAIAQDCILNEYYHGNYIYTKFSKLLNLEIWETKIKLVKYLNGGRDEDIEKLCPMIAKYRSSLKISKERIERMEENFNEWDNYFKYLDKKTTEKYPKPSRRLEYIFYKKKTHKGKVLYDVWTKTVLKKGAFQVRGKDGDYAKAGMNTAPLTRMNRLYEEAYSIESDIMGILVATLKSEYDIDVVQLHDEILVEKKNIELAGEVFKKVVEETYSGLKINLKLGEKK